MDSHQITPKACISSTACRCISSMRSVVYHQAAGKYTLARDEIQGRNAPLMICTALRAVMIYQACGLDKKIPRTRFSVFFCWGTGILNQVLHQGSTCAKNLKCKTSATELRGGSHRIIQTKKQKRGASPLFCFLAGAQGF